MSAGGDGGEVVVRRAIYLFIPQPAATEALLRIASARPLSFFFLLGSFFLMALSLRLATPLELFSAGRSLLGSFPGGAWWVRHAVVLLLLASRLSRYVCSSMINWSNCSFFRQFLGFALIFWKELRNQKGRKATIRGGS
jgi:hypothetical protein